MSLISRSGESDITTNGHYDYWQFDASTGKIVKWEQGNPVVGRSYSSYAGYDHLHFHRRVRRGELLSHTPWTKFVSDGSGGGSIGPLSAVVSGNDIDTWWTTGTFPIGDSWVSLGMCEQFVPSNAIALTQNAASSIMGESHDTLTFLAELASTKRMFLDAGKRLLKLKFPKSWRQMSNDWLSYRYGWRTFAYDCKDLHKALGRLDEKRTRYSKRSKSLDSWTDARTLFYTPTILGTRFSCKEVKTCTITVSAVGTVNADIIVPPFKFNPVETAWELIPYSFMVDWFIGVGKSLSALSFLVSNTHYVASWGCKVTVDLNLETTGTSVKPGVTGSLTSTCVGKGEYEVRVPCSVPVTPQLTFKVDMAKVVDLVSMIIQRV